MDKPIPRKRRSIHDKNPSDEMKDNEKNQARVTRQTTKKLQESQTNKNDINSDDEEGSDPQDLNATYTVETNTPNRKEKNTNFSKEKSKENGAVYEPESINNSQNKLKDNHKEKTKKAKQTSDSQKLSAKALKNKNSYKKWILITTVITILVLIAALCFKFEYFYKFSSSVDSQISVPKETNPTITKVKMTLKSLSKKFMNQEKDLWRDAYTAITNIIRNPETPSIIVLLGSKSDPLDCLTLLLGNVSSNALNSNTLKLTPDEFAPDMGLVIESLRTKIQKNKAVIIWDLLNINVEALKAFHNLCDRINPLVKEVIYIITIISDDYDKKQNPTAFIEKELLKKLSGKMKNDAIQPLITRITDGPIITIKSEQTATECPRLPTV